MIQSYIHLMPTDPAIYIEPIHLVGSDRAARDFVFGGHHFTVMGSINQLRPKFALPHGYGRDEMFEYGQPAAPEFC